MKNLILAGLVLFAGSSAFAQISFSAAQTLACREAQRVDFQFETTCEDEFNKYDEVTATTYNFVSSDASGNCGIKVWVQKVTGQVKSEVGCE